MPIIALVLKSNASGYVCADIARNSRMQLEPNYVVNTVAKSIK